jgi:3'-5' exoribonuclease
MTKYERAADENLGWLQCKAGTLGVAQWAEPVLTMEELTKCSGSSKPESHHYGTGGLIWHIQEVAKLCDRNNEILGTPVDPGALFLAALYHDVGKIWDYAEQDEQIVTHRGPLGRPVHTPTVRVWGPTPHKDLIHHINRSALVWMNHSNGYPFRDEVWHAILAHHGLAEWGSPVQPQTKLAWLLHLCDNLSARIDDCDRKAKT